ncbi:CHAT domain-containing protein [Nostoc sp. FACHB-133]|uniref:CHAT domain-containing protein n=1 Tax=Nostoc sp. FACHB-133 TaxID=2692835 RepID=UPI00168700B7|nr:CHAT domain-containing protein [Nostoc sp. FACHB-133]MBD2527808.1 CHAT domain-containing protein [Nostoc sp. FACHB-133]
MQRLPYRIRRVWAVLFLTTLTFCLWLAHPSLTIGHKGILEIATAQLSSLTQPVQQGLKLYQAGDIQGAIKSWRAALLNQQRTSNYSEKISVRTYLVRAYQQVGQIPEAIAQLKEVIAYYRQKNEPIKVGRMLTEQAQLYSSLGQQRRAITILCGQNQSNARCTQDSAIEIARHHSDDLGEVAAWGSLGNAHRLQGEYEQAISNFERSDEIAKRVDNQTYIVSNLNGLANTYASLAKSNQHRAKFASEVGDKKAAKKYQQYTVANNNQAVDYFEQSLNLARSQNDKVNELRSLLGLVKLYYHQHSQDKAIVNNTLQQALIVVEQLPDSRDKAYAVIQLANLLQIVNQKSESISIDPAIQCLKSESLSKAVELLNKAVVITQKIQDQEGESFSKGRLGHIYECGQDYQQALNLTQQALIGTVADENLYLWAWQAGRLFKATGRVKEAIIFYEKSIESLKSIRSDLIIQQRDLQFDFRDNVEPVYRELLELRLEQTNNLVQISDIQHNLESVLPIVDELRLAELQNYLGNNCDLAFIQKPAPLVGKNTAVLSSIILKEHLAIILTLADKEQKIKSKVFWIPVKNQEVRDIINDLRIKLEKRSDLENTYQARAKQIYDWFIRPFISDLEKEKIETLVFIQDGILRSIPIAALFNGKQFLIEKYAIAFAPAFTLTNLQQSNPKRLQVLAFGLTQPATVETDAGSKFFEPLTQVQSELKAITTSLPKSKGLLDQDFTRERLEKELKENTYPIIHLATHGKFGIDDRETFLVTGKKMTTNPQKSVTTGTYNEKLTLNDLYELINSTRIKNQPIELLTLTACETAVGSDRETLGLAGIAIQAGSQSAIASLWKVDDAATAQLIAKFYQSWHSGMSKAKALQTVQIAWLQAHKQQIESHPGYWAPFILIGNWL